MTTILYKESDDKNIWHNLLPSSKLSRTEEHCDDLNDIIQQVNNRIDRRQRELKELKLSLGLKEPTLERSNTAHPSPISSSRKREFTKIAIEDPRLGVRLKKELETAIDLAYVLNNLHESEDAIKAEIASFAKLKKLMDQLTDTTPSKRIKREEELPEVVELLEKARNELKKAKSHKKRFVISGRIEVQQKAKKSFAVASQYLEDALRQNRKSLATQILSAECFLELNQLQAALMSAREALIINPNSFRASFWQIVALFRSGEIKEARSLALELSKKNPSSLDLNLLLAEINQKENQPSRN